MRFITPNKNSYQADLFASNSARRRYQSSGEVWSVCLFPFRGVAQRAELSYLFVSIYPSHFHRFPFYTAGNTPARRNADVILALTSTLFACLLSTHCVSRGYVDRFGSCLLLSGSCLIDVQSVNYRVCSTVKSFLRRFLCSSMNWRKRPG